MDSQILLWNQIIFWGGGRAFQIVPNPTLMPLCIPHIQDFTPGAPVATAAATAAAAAATATAIVL